MPICDCCDQEIRTAKGCLVTTETDGTPRVPYGHEGRFDEYHRCHDCGVLPGEFHHPNCDVEECPRCHQQRLGCGCFE